MSVQTMSRLFAVAAVMIGGLVAITAATGLAGRIWAPAERGWATIVISVRDRALVVAWLTATLATLGSLYYSEIAGFEPCTFCWYQRIAMYPLSLILAIAAIGRDRRVWRFVAPIAAIGAAISAYHYLIQQFPELSTGAACSSGVPCTAAYVWEFGFVSIPFMALVAFSVILLMGSIDRSEPAA